MQALVAAALVLPLVGAATPGSVCWTALQGACPFSGGAECDKCAGGQRQFLTLAGCQPSDTEEYCSDAPLSFTYRVEKLSSARRDIGATSVGGRAVFAGGCTMTGDGSTQFICDKGASPTVDIFSAEGLLVHTVNVSEPRGWMCAAPSGDSTVVLAGGGTSGVKPHSRTADVLDLDTLEIKSYPEALSVGRWGIGCATVGGRTFFTGGKVTISGYDNAYCVGSIDSFSASAGSTIDGTWTVAPYNLSVARESVTTVEVGGSLLVAGGWRAMGKYGPTVGEKTVDLFSDPVLGPPAKQTKHSLKYDAYAVGAATVNGTAYVVGNAFLYKYSGNAEVGEPIRLPVAMAGVETGNDDSGVVPGGNVQANGVAVGGKYACFAGAPTKTVASAVYCLNVVTERWSRLPCSSPHKGGGIATVGDNIVLVGGGFDPADKMTTANDIVDVFVLDLQGGGGGDRDVFRCVNNTCVGVPHTTGGWPDSATCQLGCG